MPQSVDRMLDAYRRGLYTDDEMALRVIENVPSQTIRDYMNVLPNQIVSLVRDIASGAPTTDADWDSFEYLPIRPGCVRLNAPKLKVAELQRQEEDDKHEYRNCIALLQRYFRDAT